MFQKASRAIALTVLLIGPAVLGPQSSAWASGGDGGNKFGSSFENAGDFFAAFLATGSPIAAARAIGADEEEIDREMRANKARAKAAQVIADQPEPSATSSRPSREDGSTHFIKDTRNIFLNPERVNQYRSYVVTEWGDANDNDDPNAEGGFFREAGSFAYGVYLGNADKGRDDANSESTLKQAPNFYAYGADGLE
ncbi:MAG: hypothetical protein AAF530_18225 [Pseudomonadota bacterium]